MKIKLGCLYGNCSEYLYPNLSDALLQRKLKICIEASVPLHILDDGNIGENKWKTRLRKEIVRVEFLLRKKITPEAVEI